MTTPLLILVSVLIATNVVIWICGARHRRALLRRSRGLDPNGNPPP
ncbi:hypothetical protein [Nocardia arthritidis]|uniref:Uncharacterized protein n=1 Tax=Nocardia arthritidis TaxID=228602 RepID=A0A6G9YEQ4_9NOCA|nr:hypothetical protein [Nocardia arthritidis]QIS11610.1 hypothetical protein F5544_18695 [Nocardia arthritidis]